MVGVVLIQVDVGMVTTVVVIETPMFPVAKYAGMNILLISVHNSCKSVLLSRLPLILLGSLKTLAGLAMFLRQIQITVLIRVLRLTYPLNSPQWMLISPIMVMDVLLLVPNNL